MDPLLRDDRERARFLELVDDSNPDGCWPWTGPIRKTGYGVFNVRRDREGVPGRRWVGLPAHRVAYALWHGEVPDTIDHLCHTRDPSCRLGDNCLHRRCVRPGHLENVANIENIRRAVATGRTGGLTTHSPKTHCPRGHAYAGANLMLKQVNGRFHRQCRRCFNVSSRDAQRRRYVPHPREKKPPPPPRLCHWCEQPLAKGVIRYCNGECRQQWILNDGKHTGLDWR